MMRNAMLISLAALGLSACVTDDIDNEDVDGPTTASTVLRDSAGRNVGTASVNENESGVRVRIESTALSQGVHGAHVHAVGRCDAPDFASAGPHWNPNGRQHGSLNPQGPHHGDLPNLLVGTDGRGTLEFVLPAGSVGRGDHAMFDGDGAAVVIHATADDYRTDPSGNSGARIACGVLG